MKQRILPIFVALAVVAIVAGYFAGRYYADKDRLDRNRRAMEEALPVVEPIEFDEESWDDHFFDDEKSDPTVDENSLE